MKHQVVGLFVQSRRADMEEQLRVLFDFFIAHKVEFLFEKNSYGNLSHQLQDATHELFDAGEPPDSITLFVVVGGDGSFLHACQLLYQHQRPITGVNLGTLGFLTDINIDSLEEQLLPVLRDEGEVDERHFLRVESEQLPVKTLALNDVVVQTGESGRIVELRVTIDGKLAYDLRCDGIILATPTGSTAYALSAGGPLVHNQVDALLLVPLAAHNLATRPSVIPANSSVALSLVGESPSAQVSVDGQQAMMLAVGESITIAKSTEAVYLMHPPDRDFCAAWRAKLGWSQSLV